MSHAGLVPSLARRAAPADASVPPELGVELLSLCQTAAADGTLSPRERQDLAKWLEQGHAARLPQAAHVEDLARHVLAAGKATPAELADLSQALGAVLPPAVGRQGPTAQRFVPRATPVEVDAIERLPNEVIASAQFIVAGCREKRCAAAIERRARAGDPVLLVREPHAQSPNGVRVCLASGRPIGFLPEPTARELAPLLDQGARYRAHLTQIARGAHARIPLVQAYLYAADATLGDQSPGARRIAQRDSAGALWLLRIAIGLLIAALVSLALRA